MILRIEFVGSIVGYETIDLRSFDDRLHSIMLTGRGAGGARDDTPRLRGNFMTVHRDDSKWNRDRSATIEQTIRQVFRVTRATRGALPDAPRTPEDTRNMECTIHGASRRINRERSTEEAIDDWISGRIERCQTLYEGSDCDIRLSRWHIPINLKEVENYVWTPAEDKY